jgi:putative transport protein
LLQTVARVLEHSPILALFAAIGLGYALGRISIAGFSLGVGAVLFAGLALGAIAPKAAPPGLVSSIGLVMFLYGIGIQYGTQFFAGLSGPGLKWNLLGVIAVLGALGVALALGAAAGVTPAYSMGLFAGALTSTPTLQAALDAAGNGDPAIGYSVAYPFGVIGPILCIFAFSRLVKPRLAEAPAPLQPLEITLGEPAGATVLPGAGQPAARRGARRDPPGPHEQAARSASPPRARGRRLVVRHARCFGESTPGPRPRGCGDASRRTGAPWT